jgi:hypothetical protein
MPRAPKGEKRPADVIGNAVHAMGLPAAYLADISNGRDVISLMP